MPTSQPEHTTPMNTGVPVMIEKHKISETPNIYPIRNVSSCEFSLEALFELCGGND